MQNELLKKVLSKLNIVGDPDKDGRIVAWCPFHNDGEGQPPHNPNLYVWPDGFLCHACGEKGSIYELAKHLGVEVKNTVNENSDNFEATFDYRDEENKLLFQVVRKPGKKFLQRSQNGKGGWKWNLKDVRRVLYNLPQLISRSDEVVFIVEGGKDANTLTELGLLATTNPGGAGKWRKEYNEFLKGRETVILPDNDEPGLSHARQVAKSLSGTARSVKLVELPDLEEKEDVTDWLAKGNTAKRLLDIISQTEQWIPPQVEEEDNASELAEQSGERIEIVDLVLKTGIVLFHDERKEPYAAVPLSEGRRNIGLNSKTFKEWISHLVWKHLKRAYSQEVLEAANRVLCGMAKFDCPEHCLNVRSARKDGAIWIDLDGIRAIRVTPEGWEIVSQPPILFRSFSIQQPLPDPVKGGNPWEVHNFVNLKDENAKFLLLCYLVVAFVPDIPIAALILHGVQGTAKTTLLKIVRKLLDPSVVEVRGNVKNQEDFVLSAFRNRVLFFDNITTVSEWLSDAICRAVTGEGQEKRTLYTDEDTTFFEYKRVVGLAGINMVANRPDLLDRSVIFYLDPISPGSRLDEESFWREFYEVRPRILGGLLDVLSKAMGILPELQLKNLPRMADFARWGAAVAMALGRSKAEFMFAYEQNVNRQNEAAIEASPVAQAVIKFMENREKWEGTASDLLKELEEIAETDLSINVHRKPWPQASNVLWYRLQEVRPNLLAENISVERDRTGSRRSIRLRRVVEESSQSSSSSVDTPEGKEKGNDGRSDDGCDSDDGSADKLRGEAKAPSMTPQETAEEEAHRVAKEMYPALFSENKQYQETKKAPNDDNK